MTRKTEVSRSRSKSVGKPKSKAAPIRNRSRSQSKGKAHRGNAPKPAPVQPNLGLDELLGTSSAVKSQQRASASKSVQRKPAPSSGKKSKKPAKPLAKSPAKSKPTFSHGQPSLVELLEASTPGETYQVVSSKSQTKAKSPAKGGLSLCQAARGSCGKASESARHPHHDKISHFMGKLKSRNGNPKQNAEILAEIITAFSDGKRITKAEILTIASKPAGKN